MPDKANQNQMLEKPRSDIDALLARVDGKHPSQEDITALRQLLADTSAKGWGIAGSTEIAYGAVVKSCAGGQRAALEVIEHDAYKKAAGVGLPERGGARKAFFIDAVVLAWLRQMDVERRYANVMAESVTLAVGDFWERRLTAAERRYMRRALETLMRACGRVALPGRASEYRRSTSEPGESVATITTLRRVNSHRPKSDVTLSGMS